MNGRSLLASVIGWAIVAVVVFVLFGFIVGTIRFLFRIGLVVIVLAALLWAYLTLKSPPDP